MINSLDSSSNQFLAALDRIAAYTGRANRQITSGLRISRPSDAPDEVSEVLHMQAVLSRVGQVQKNLARVKAEVDAGESALQIAGKLLDKIRSLGAQGATGTSSAAQRTLLAQQIESLQKELVDLTGTTVEGRYVFGGDLDSSAPYRFDASQPNGVVQLTQPVASRLVKDARGGEFQAGRTAPEIFDHRDSGGGIAPDNVFAAVNALRNALNADDSSAIDSALGQVSGSQGWLGQQLGWYGVLQNRTASAISDASKLFVDMTAELSAKRDADIPAAALALTQSQVQQQAVFGAQTNTSRMSLFDYLK
jgi:flagellar hook-associated protein 3 FlgL